ncbi:KilA-N domain-containing protein [Salmonella enterica]|nr:KilA-N domain-containing protein [Salmonella enterica]EBL7405565.1 KilA-N domain-containing protein [Salmonella enterica]
MLTLSDGVSVAQDVKGRFCVNDLHVAAGGERRHEPANWLSLQQTKDLVSEILNTEISVFNSPAMKITPIESVRGRNGGTYVCRELVYAYAMWISPAFHLRVIRAFDAMASNVAPRAEAAPGLDASLEDTRFVVDAQGQLSAAADLLRGWIAGEAPSSTLDDTARNAGIFQPNAETLRFSRL